MPESNSAQRFPVSDEEPTPVDDSQLSDVEDVSQVHAVDDAQKNSTEGDSQDKTRTRPALVREPGKSLLPFSRVQKILKADRELPMVQREAAFLISVAAEEFVKRITEATYRAAEREGRTTMQQKDIAALVRRVNEFTFLDDIIPWPDPNARAARKPKAALEGQEDIARELTLLDRFVNAEKKSKPGDVEPAEESTSNGIITMNEDGTMSVDP